MAPRSRPTGSRERNDSEEAARLFAQEYDRINRFHYANALPPFPGVEVVDRTDVFSLTRAAGFGAWPRLRPFVLSRHLKGDLLLEAIRHEIAHAAAILFDAEVDHGPAWQRHVKLVGAQGMPTLDPGHALRTLWPSP